MSTRLSVNVNKVAVLRNSRGGGTPDVTRAALTCLEAGAHGITVHPRPDRRHIVAEDLPPLAGLCARFGVEFNIEGNPFAAPRAARPIPVTCSTSIAAFLSAPLVSARQMVAGR